MKSYSFVIYLMCNWIEWNIFPLSNTIYLRQWVLYHIKSSLVDGMSFDTMDPRLKHPFGAVISGPTCCGKSHLLRKMLERGEEVIDGAPQNIIWCHGMYQPAHDEMMETIPNITFIEGLPSDLETRIDPTKRNLIVIDDLMNELSNNKRLTNIFTKSCHHLNLSCFLILHNVFCQGKEIRNISLNAHYLFIFKSPRDSSQITHLAKQMYPGNVKFMQEAFIDATSKPYGYLLCDLKPETDDQFRLWTNLFPEETQYVYVRKV